MPVPYCVYSEISEESAVWESKGRCARDTADVVPIQESRDYRRSGMRRSCTPVPEHSTEDNGKPVCRVLEGKVSVDDLRQAPRTGGISLRGTSGREDTTYRQSAMWTRKRYESTSGSRRKNPRRKVGR